MSEFRRYVAVIEQNERLKLFAHIPDLPGPTASGRTVDEVLRLIADFADDHVADLVKEGHDVPEARAWEDVPHDPEVKEHMRAIVPVLIPPKVPRIMKVSISIEEEVLERIDHAARLDGKTRSGFIADAAGERAREIIEKPMTQAELVKMLTKNPGIFREAVEAAGRDRRKA